LSLAQKVQAVEEAFILLSQEMANFQGWSGLSCKAGCGKCCNKPDIEATVLEFLPLAHHLFTENQCDLWLQRLDDYDGTICLLLGTSATGGNSCSAYLHRGLVCRLFGYSARMNKYALKEFVSCQIIKSEQADRYSATLTAIGAGSFVPVMSHHYMRLYGIDPTLARDFYPINQAIKRAIQTVLQYYAYQNLAD
jgi:Fe-S-cluster containining protein